MRLLHLEVRNFRSVENASLDQCGNFNVLIGKNNSGKSNMLSAVDHVFRFLGGQTLATAEPTLDKAVDIFGMDLSQPIELEAVLEPNQGDMTQLVDAIGTEYPQVQNALPDPIRYGLFRVEIKVLHKPVQIQYLSSLSVTDSPDRRPGKQILGVSEKLAIELANRDKRVRTLDRDSSILEPFIRGFDADDWERLKNRRISYTVSSVFPDELSRDAGIEIRRLIDTSESYHDARTKLEAFQITSRERLDAIKSRSLDSPLTAFAGATDTIPEYVKHAMGVLGAANVLHLADRRKPIGSSEASRLLQLKMSRGGDSTLRSIQNTVGSLLGVQIDAFVSDQPDIARRRTTPANVRRTGRGNLPDAELDVDNFLVEVNGSGVREALRVVLDLEFEKPDILLVEEPEVHLHPALEIAMMQHLKQVSSGSTQVFLTTHSTNFLDTGDMRNVYMLRSDRSTTVQHLEVSEAETEVPKELGIRLSSVFMFDRLVFAEGQTDELVLRTFAQALGLNFSQANVGFVLMGGSRNFTHYAASATLTLLAKRRVQSYFILDRDEHGADDIEKLTSQLGEYGNLHVLARREIENYLIDPATLAMFIKSRRPHEDEPSAEQLSLDLQEVADELRSLSVAKRVLAQVCRAQRVSRDKILSTWPARDLLSVSIDAIDDLERQIADMKHSVSGLIASAEEETTKDWDKQRLHVVPGDELLDGVLRRYGLRYRKDRDAGELAARIDTSNIPREICDLLRDICSHE